jgi:hypothetical protein
MIDLINLSYELSTSHNGPLMTCAHNNLQPAATSRRAPCIRLQRFIFQKAGGGAGRPRAPLARRASLSPYRVDYISRALAAPATFWPFWRAAPPDGAPGWLLGGPRPPRSTGAPGAFHSFSACCQAGRPGDCPPPWQPLPKARHLSCLGPPNLHRRAFHALAAFYAPICLRGRRLCLAPPPLVFFTRRTFKLCVLASGPVGRLPLGGTMINTFWSNVETGVNPFACRTTLGLAPAAAINTAAL